MSIPIHTVDGRGFARAAVIARREVRDQFRDWRILAPIVILTLVFPPLATLTARQAVRFVEQYGAPIIGDRLIPFLLMIVGFFPISISLVIALESFAGEKERHSLEPLLATPLTNLQLYLGKMVASTLPPLVGAFLGIAVYLAGLYFALGFLPDAIVITQIVILTFVQAVVMVAGAVVVSTQTTSVRAANLLASFIIIPMALLVQGESLIMFWGRYNVLWLIIGGELVLVALLVRMGVRLFNREELLGREIDDLNLRWLWRRFWRAFVGARRGGVLAWYRHELGATVVRLRVPLLLMAVAMVAAVGVGAHYGSVFQLPAEFVALDNLSSDFAERLQQFGLFTPRGMVLVLLQNARALALATLLGVFSLGVLSSIIVMVPAAFGGYFAAQVALAGGSPLAFTVAFLTPHGIFEIPAILLVGAAVLRLGATVVSPPPGKSVGEAWVTAFADWARVAGGLALPLLLLGAAAEVFLTPRIVIAVFGGG